MGRFQRSAATEAVQDMTESKKAYITYSHERCGFVVQRDNGPTSEVLAGPFKTEDDAGFSLLLWNASYQSKS